MNLFEKKYRCGTLNYSVMSLSIAMGLILLGFFCYSLATLMVSQAIPLRLKELGASSKTIAFILTTIGGFFNMTVCPTVSFKSDRHRGKWGRRIPFILGTLPMFCGAMVFFGLSDWFTALLHPVISRWASVSPTTLTVTLIGIIMAIYQFFYMFVGSVIWYIYNDVIPSQYLARIVGMVQVATTLAGAMFNFFIFKYSLSHFKWVLFGAAVIYGAGLLTMCLFLKEPEYPPVDETQKKESQGIRGIMTFMKESFSHPLYLNKFLSEALLAVSGTMWTFGVFFNQDMGLSLEQIGSVNGSAGIVLTLMSIGAAVFLTVLVDRWHPVRLYLLILIFMLLPIFYNLKWIFVTPPPSIFWWQLLAYSITTTIINVCCGLSSMPCLMRLYPKSRFGQFCSAGALVRSVTVIVFGYICGVYVDLLKNTFGFGEHGYRGIFVWQLFWTLLALFFTIRAYRWWVKLGGAEHYKAPAPWSPEKYEEMPITEVVGSNPRALRIVLVIISAFYVLMAGGAVGLYIAARRLAEESEVHTMLNMAIPCAAVALIAWLLVLRGMLRDIRLYSEGKPTVNGIPHHGLLMILAVYLGAILVVNFYESIAALVMNAGCAAILWSLESIIAFLITLIVWGITKIEKR